MLSNGKRRLGHQLINYPTIMATPEIDAYAMKQYGENKTFVATHIRLVTGQYDWLDAAISSKEQAVDFISQLAEVIEVIARTHEIQIPSTVNLTELK